jgi:hypothetical protein
MVSSPSIITNRSISSACGRLKVIVFLPSICSESQPFHHRSWLGVLDRHQSAHDQSSFRGTGERFLVTQNAMQGGSVHIHGDDDGIQSKFYEPNPRWVASAKQKAKGPFSYLRSHRNRTRQKSETMIAAHCKYILAFYLMPYLPLPSHHVMVTNHLKLNTS